MGAMLGVLIAGALTAPWHSAWTVDDRTYIEMTRGVVDHGLPYLDNGPAGHFHSLVARWNNFASGHLWGTYTPGYPYLVALALALGGVTAVIRLNYVFLALAALCVQRLGTRATGSRSGGAVTVLIFLAATPALGMSQVFSPYTALIAGTAATLCLVDSALGTLADSRPRLALALALMAGTAAALTALLNPVSIAVCAASLCALALSPSLSTSDTKILIFVSRNELRTSLLRGLTLAAGFVLGALPLMALTAALNHRRFGSYNPFAAGECVWPSIATLCHGGGPIGYSARALISAAGLPLVWALSLTAVLVFSRARARLALTAALVLAAVAIGPLRERLWGMGGLLWSYTVDPEHALSGSSFALASDGLGRLSGPAVVKSLLQNAPVLTLAALAWSGEQNPGKRRLFILCSLTALAHFFFLSARYTMPGEHALGWPFAELRYNLPAVVSLSVLTAMGARAVCLTRRDVAVAVVVALTVGVWLAIEATDAGFVRRFVLLRVTLIAGFAALASALAARWRVSPSAPSIAPVAVAVALGLSIAVNLGGDYVLFARLRSAGDALTDIVAARVPSKFAIVGRGSTIDTVLALRASRDVQYVDLNEAHSPAEFLALTQRWREERREVFALGPRSLAQALSSGGFEISTVDPRVGLYRIEAPTSVTRGETERR